MQLTGVTIIMDKTNKFDQPEKLMRNAAKAARHAGFVVWPDADENYHHGIPGQSTPWKPMEDKGDAFSLMVLLKMHIGMESDTVSAWDKDRFGNFQTEILAHFGDEIATCRAIVRAAAEMGRTLV